MASLIKSFNKRTIFLIVILVISTFDLATFFYLPLLSSVRQELNVSESLIQLSAAVNTFGIGVSSIIYGTLSDAWGRKKIMLFGIICFAISSYSISFIDSIYLLIALRFTQGVGAGVAWSLGNAIIHDVYRGKEFEKAIVVMHIIIGIVVVVSPAIGGFVGDLLGWRNSFKLMSYTAVILFIYAATFLPETLQNNKTKINIKTILNNYSYLFKNNTFIKFLVVKFMMVSLAFVNVTTLPLIFVETYNDTLETCGILMGLGAGIFALGGIINNKLINHFKIEDIIKLALYLVMLSSLVLIISEPLKILNSLSIQLIKAPYLIGIGCIFGNATHKVVGAIPKLSGSASSMMITLEMFVSSIGIELVSVFYNSTVYPVEIYSICVATISLLMLRIKE